MTRNDYEAWLQQAPAGSILIYHTGELARDRGRYGPKMEWLPHEPLHSLASRIYEDAERGLVILTQQAGPQVWGSGPIWDPVRLPRYFEYRAQRTTKEM